jgi:hypothetical protein
MSRHTADNSTSPVAILLKLPERPRRSRPFPTLATRTAPRSTPIARPRPPNRLAPPMTAAAIASSERVPREPPLLRETAPPSLALGAERIRTSELRRAGTRAVDGAAASASAFTASCGYPIRKKGKSRGPRLSLDVDSRRRDDPPGTAGSRRRITARGTFRAALFARAGQPR